jgi:hypothetical protein
VGVVQDERGIATAQKVNRRVANDSFTLLIRNASSGTALVAVSRAFNRDPIRANDCKTSLTYRLNSLR